MSTKFVRLTVAVAALAMAANGLAVPQPEGVAFSMDAFTDDTLEPFSPDVELQKLQVRYPVAEQTNARRADYGNTQDFSKQKGSAKVKASSSGLSFFVPTVIGNQTFNLIYDTGSSDLWVYSNESSIFQSEDHPTYRPTSSAHLLPKYTWSIKYAGGSEVSGIVYTDTVKAGPVVAHKQAVQAATVIQTEFASDGILGLASGAINTVKPVKQKTFFETLLPTLERKLFAANLRADGKPSTWDFGYIDKSKFKGNIVYTPVVGDQKHWTVHVGSYAVGKGSFTKEEIGDVIIDSGTSLIYLPDPVVNDYYTHIKGYKLQEEGTHTFPCNTTIPDLNFKIENTALTVPGRAINYTVYDPDQRICAGAVSPQLNMRYSVLGSLFMKYYYVIHSREEAAPKMGFASHQFRIVF